MGEVSHNQYTEYAAPSKAYEPCEPFLQVAVINWYVVRADLLHSFTILSYVPNRSSAQVIGTNTRMAENFKKRVFDQLLRPNIKGSNNA